MDGAARKGHFELVMFLYSARTLSKGFAGALLQDMMESSIIILHDINDEHTPFFI
jgi:hypothetical protein